MMDATADSAASSKPPAEFDARGLKPPENVLAILRKAAALPAGASLRIVADCYPFQLYDLLQQRGFFLEMTRESSGSWTGLITPRQAEASKHPAAI